MSAAKSGNSYGTNQNYAITMIKQLLELLRIVSLELLRIVS